jgi:hypothetical protein
MDETEIEQLKQDFYRFSQLHSWYKHLPVTPVPFIFYKKQGQQLTHRYHLLEQDQTKEYWHFERLYDEVHIQELVDANIKVYIAHFGSFLRGIEKDTGYTWGFTIMPNCNPSKYAYLKTLFPDFTSKIDLLEEYDNNISNPILSDQEYENTLNILFTKVQDIYLNNVLELNPYLDNKL